MCVTGTIVRADDQLTRRSLINATACVCCLSALPIRIVAAASNATGVDLGAEGLPNLLKLAAHPMTRIAQTVWVKRGTVASVLKAGVRLRGANTIIAQLLLI